MRRRHVLIVSTVILALLGLLGGLAAASQPASPLVRAQTPCRLGDKLVPSCGVLWGAAPAAYVPGDDPVDATAGFERATDSVMDVYHSYHKNAELFPTAGEREVADAGSYGRLLMMNYKPATSHTWRDVADGVADHRLERLGAYIKRTFDRPFFLTIWHEPENDVVPTRGSGMTAEAYRAMFRHVEDVLDSAGATKIVYVMDYQGYPKFTTEPFYPRLWPGRDYVDWVASDSYNTGNVSGWNTGDFSEMVNRTNGDWPGFYDYWSKRFPQMPLMLAEWGVVVQEPNRQSWFFDTVRQELKDYPNLKAMLYFDTTHGPTGSTDLRSSSASVESYRELTDSVQRVYFP